MKGNRHLLAVALIALIFPGLSACNRGRTVEAAREDRPPSVTPAEQNFMKKATEASLTEIDVSRMAMRKTDNTDVRDYANMIKSDHTEALGDLADIMRDKDVPEPATPAAEVQKDIDRMNLLTGPEFDREFVNMMVADHQKAVELFRDEAVSAQDQDVRKYVNEVLPKLEMHLDKAQRLQSALFRGVK